MMRLPRSLAVVLAAAAASLVSPAGAATGPVIDMHVHVSDPALPGAPFCAAAGYHDE